LLQRVHLLALPTVGFTVPTIQECKEGWLNIDGKKIRLSDERGGADSLCAIPFNVTELVFSVAHAYEQATEWHNRRPKIVAD
jgi:hypothetical protein